MGRRSGVRWEEYVGGGERRLAADHGVQSVAVDGGHVCGGLTFGSIMVWCRSTLEHEQTLTGHRGCVLALLFVGGRLVSGSRDHSVRVWDVGAGRCEGVLEGHTHWVTSLAVSGSRLLSGSYDGTVRVWGMEGEASSWRCERTLVVQGSSGYVECLAAWGDRVACGFGDGGIRVWSLETWGFERILRGHKGSVFALVVSGKRLVSGSRDGTVRVWSGETWGCVETVEAYPADADQYIRALAVCGSALVVGSFCGSASVEREVRVWDLETLRPLHTLRQPAGDDVRSLLSDGWCWAAAAQVALCDFESVFLLVGIC